ncbi:MAG: BrnT family toxin [SAR324 cluster bacterium]|nr:BrnT family toxin [SAR324 cluster bacterium]
MEFEYDPDKSIKNKQKHHIDFDEARFLWNDENRLQIQAKSESEPRFALIAQYQQKLWSAFYTIRQHKIRIISVRRARIEERKLYEES